MESPIIQEENQTKKLSEEVTSYNYDEEEESTDIIYTISIMTPTILRVLAFLEIICGVVYGFYQYADDGFNNILVMLLYICLGIISFTLFFAIAIIVEAANKYLYREN